jgi:hypothetical protein
MRRGAGTFHATSSGCIMQLAAMVLPPSCQDVSAPMPGEGAGSVRRRIAHPSQFLGDLPQHRASASLAGCAATACAPGW